MRAPSAAARRVAPESPRELSNGCAQVDAMDRQTAAIERQTAAYEAQSTKLDALMETINEGVAAFTPAANEIRDLGQAQKKLCAFLVGHRLKLAASVPTVLILVGGVSPNAAHVISELLKVWGVR